MPTKNLMTAAEFAETGPETDGFELVRGELAPIPPAKGRHGKVCGNVVTLLGIYKKSIGKGCVLCNDTGIITENDPDPSAEWMSPSWRIARSWRAIDPPDLAVETCKWASAWSGSSTPPSARRGNRRLLTVA
jgi:Uma2 family endonuclease